MRRAGADRRAHRLLRWYPKAWRNRYGDEFTQLLIDDIDDRPRSWRRTLDVARSGLTARAARERPIRLADLSLATAAAVLALGSAAYLSSLHLHTRTYHFDCAGPVRFSRGVTCGPNVREVWQLPVAVLIAGLGVGMAFGLAWRSGRVVMISVLAGVGGIAAVVATLGVADLWHRWTALSSQCLGTYVRGLPPGRPLPSPGIICLAVTGHGPPGLWTYLGFGLVFAVAGVCLFAIVPPIRQASLGVGIVRPLTRSRLAVALLIVGTTLVGAAILHRLQSSQAACPHGFVCAPRSPWYYPPHAWAGSAALAIFLLGATAAVGLLLTPRRLGATVLVLGTALAAATVLVGHEVPPTSVPFAYRPDWVDPATLGVLLSGLAGAAAILTTSRRRIA